MIWLHVIKQFWHILKLIFIKYKVEDFRGHILRSCHGELSQIGELERTSIINQFYFFNNWLVLEILISCRAFHIKRFINDFPSWGFHIECLLTLFILGFQLYKNILSFQIRMNDIILGQQHQSLRNFIYNLFEQDLIAANGRIELLIMYPIHFFPIIVLTFQFIQHIPQRITTLLIQQPRVFLVDEVVVKFD